ncbi:hypothetical protein OO184_09040 [Photorhabdus sp. APURE]|uniref:hypothetical protein n=1 Tax=Photorhabdus aballayi TaxID=2991723 RepID=UPI00223D8961|nr:hypothetical protein [Photorhabdus aballayi]MCW7548080.1 hypothetical protein [Photorhabdus aballayi]
MNVLFLTDDQSMSHLCFAYDLTYESYTNETLRVVTAEELLVLPFLCGWQGNHRYKKIA